MHISRHLATSLLTRPISVANSAYVAECLKSANAIRSELLTWGPSLPHPWNRLAHALSLHLSRVITTCRPQDLAQLERFVRMSRYDGPHQTLRRDRRLPQGILEKRNYTKITVVVGPGIGVGDEIAFMAFYRRLIKRHPKASVTVFTFFPGTWRSVEPNLAVHDLVGDPLSAYRHIDREIQSSQNGESLVVFASFIGLELFLGYTLESTPLDLVEVAVGRGALWCVPHGETRPRYINCSQPLAPSIPRALKRLGAFVFGPRPSRPTQSSTRGPARADTFRLVVNTITSKHSPITTPIWAGYIRQIRRTLPHKISLEVAIFPGMTKASEAEAIALAQAIRISPYRGPQDRCHLIKSPEGDALDAKTATPAIHRALRQAHLLLGIDTFSSHLAALVQTPALTLCLSHNPLFWQPSLQAWWLDISVGRSTVQGVINVMLRCMLGLAPPPIALQKRAHRALASLPAVPDLPLLLGGQKGHLPPWACHLEAAFQAMDEAEQKLLAQADGPYAWPLLHAMLVRQEPSSSAQAAVLLRLEATLFYRRLAAAVANDGENRSAVTLQSTWNLASIEQIRSRNESGYAQTLG